MSGLISRQAVIDAFWKLDVEIRPNVIDAILTMVNDIPSVNPQEPKTGRWIEHEIEDTLRWVTCSKCNCEMYKKFNYCPNCGAKMFEPQESDNCN